MKYSTRRNGSSIVEVVLLVAVVALIGLLGYTFYKSQQNNQATSSGTSSQSAEADDEQAAPDISSTDDLDKALKTLDDTDVEGGSDSDLSQLDTESSDF